MMRNFLYLLIIGFILSGATDYNDIKRYKLYVVTGSDWCANCKRLEKKVLGDSIFNHFIRENGIELMIIDFPQRKHQSDSIIKRNEVLIEKIGFDGSFPGIFLSGRDSSDQFRKIDFSNENAAEFIAELKRML